MEAINRAVKLATQSCTDYTTNNRYDDMVAVSADLKSMVIGYHPSFWGDDRDQGIAPLITKTVEYQLHSIGVEASDIIKALVKSFKDEIGVQLFKATISRPTETHLNRKGEIITHRGMETLTIEASDDPRLLELEVLSQLKG